MKRLISVLISVLIIAGISVSATETFYSANIAEPQLYANIGGAAYVSAGRGFATVIGGAGNMRAIGFNSAGQLGIGSYENSAEFSQIYGIAGLYKVVSGKNHTIAMTSTGKVYTWGDNTFGQVGNGTTQPYASPYAVPLGIVTDIAAGDNCTFAVTLDGSLYAWGDNTHGQLGDGTTESKLVPTKIAMPTKMATVDSGNGHTIGVSSLGMAYAWGDNSHGQLGDGTTEDKLTPTRVTAWDGAQIIALGEDFSAVLKNDGFVTVCGKNDCGQLGLGHNNSISTPEKITSLRDVYLIASGDAHMLAATYTGGVYAWGDNTYSQLGFVSDNVNTPVQTGLKTSVSSLAANEGVSVASTAMNTLYMWGNLLSGVDEPDISQIPAAKPETVNGIGVLVDGEWLECDVPPVIENGRTLVPMRAIFEKLGAEINWNDETKTVNARLGEKEVTVTIGANIGYVGAEAKQLDCPAKIQNGRTLVPIRFVAESLGCLVDWNGESKTVIITSK